VDLVALAAGVRPAILVDYMSVQPGALQGVLTQTAPAVAACQPGMRLRVGVLDGCCLLLNTRWIKRRLFAGGGQCPPRLIVFQGFSGEAAGCHWATAEESGAVVSQMSALRALLQPDGRDVVRPEPLSLDLAGLPLQPTLQGCLLGYPAVYVVTAQNIDSTARFLSSESLLLCSLAADCPALEDIARKRGDEAVLSALKNPLAAFSVPECLLQNAEAASLLVAWREDIHLDGKVATATAWSNLRFQTFSTQCNVVL